MWKSKFNKKKKKSRAGFGYFLPGDWLNGEKLTQYDRWLEDEGLQRQTFFFSGITPAD